MFCTIPTAVPIYKISNQISSCAFIHWPTNHMSLHLSIWYPAASHSSAECWLTICWLTICWVLTDHAKYLLAMMLPKPCSLTLLQKVWILNPTCWAMPCTTPWVPSAVWGSWTASTMRNYIRFVCCWFCCWSCFDVSLHDKRGCKYSSLDSPCFHYMDTSQFIWGGTMIVTQLHPSRSRPPRQISPIKLSCCSINLAESILGSGICFLAVSIFSQLLGVVIDSLYSLPVNVQISCQIWTSCAKRN